MIDCMFVYAFSDEFQAKSGLGNLLAIWPAWEYKGCAGLQWLIGAESNDQAPYKAHHEKSVILWQVGSPSREGVAAPARDCPAAGNITDHLLCDQ